MKLPIHKNKMGSGSSSSSGNRPQSHSITVPNPYSKMTGAQQVCYLKGLAHAQPASEPTIANDAFDAALCLSQKNREAYGQGYKDGYDYNNK